MKNKKKIVKKEYKAGNNYFNEVKEHSEAEKINPKKE